ncbi:MAG: AraC family transcriptional regulator [Clostridia bacterium]|nr:AraC family transcriptional regulator [Clostridia bacterium]
MEQNYNGGFHIERMKSRIPWDMDGGHTHNYHEMYYLLSGSRRYFAGQTLYNVEAGDLVVIPKGTPHHMSSRTSDNYERYVVYFSDEFFAPLAETLGEKETQRFLNFGCVSIPLQHQATLRKFFEVMEQEARHENECSRLVKSCALGNAAALALRYGKGAKSDSAEKIEKIQEVARYIRENFNQEITLCDAAQIAFMEETYFSKQFKKLTGFGFSEYVSQIRMQQAEELLRNSKLSVGKIAELCGYSGSNYFGDAFKKRYGISPMKMRKNYREEIGK